MASPQATEAPASAPTSQATTTAAAAAAAGTTAAAASSSSSSSQPPPPPPPPPPPGPSQSQPNPTSQAQAPPTTDDGLSRRPRDARLIHLILSSQGIHSYQERVPLQLLDFAYRYTSSVLSDALRLSAEGYSSAPGHTASSKRDVAHDGSAITVNALRQAVASRQDYQFQAALPKEWMLEQAADKNRTQLPRIDKSWGVQLPPEKYCLTGTGWSLKDVWESDGDDDEDDDDGDEDGAGGAKPDGLAAAINGAHGAAGERVGAMDGTADEADEDMDSFEEVFGTTANDGAGEDQEMTDG